VFKRLDEISSYGYAGSRTLAALIRGISIFPIGIDDVPAAKIWYPCFIGFLGTAYFMRFVFTDFSIIVHKLPHT